MKVHLPNIDRKRVNASCRNEAPRRFRISRSGVQFCGGIEVAADAGKGGKLCFDCGAACVGKLDHAGDHCDCAAIVERIVTEHHQVEAQPDRRFDPTGMRALVEEQAGRNGEISADGQTHRGVRGETVAHLPGRMRQIDTAETEDHRRAFRFRRVGNGKQRLKAEALEIADRIAVARRVCHEVLESNERHLRKP